MANFLAINSNPASPSHRLSGNSTHFHASCRSCHHRVSRLIPESCQQCERGPLPVTARIFNFGVMQFRRHNVVSLNSCSVQMRRVAADTVYSVFMFMRAFKYFDRCVSCGHSRGIVVKSSFHLCFDELQDKEIPKYRNAITVSLRNKY